MKNIHIIGNRKTNIINTKPNAFLPNRTVSPDNGDKSLFRHIGCIANAVSTDRIKTACMAYIHVLNFISAIRTYGYSQIYNDADDFFTPMSYDAKPMQRLCPHPIQTRPKMQRDIIDYTVELGEFASNVHDRIIINVKPATYISKAYTL